jgi:ATP-dependent helicase HrpA
MHRGARRISRSPAVARAPSGQFNLEVPVDAFRPDSAPPHLQMSFRVIDDDDGRQLAAGRKLADLKLELGSRSEEILKQETPLSDGERYTDWTMGDLPEIMQIERGAQTLIGYPALVDVGAGAQGGVSLQVFDSPEKAREMHRAGVRRLLAIAFRERIRDIEKTLARDVVLAALKDDAVAAALERTFLPDSLPLTRADFAHRVEEGRSRFSLIAQEIARAAAGMLAEQALLQRKIDALEKSFPPAAQDVRRQLERLLAPGWLARTPWERLQHLPRYLKAASLRLDKLRADPGRDARLAGELAALELPYRREVAARERQGIVPAGFEQFGWLLEELRVSLFAQELRTPAPMSPKRLSKLWQTLRR